jgi:hypothetical protein
MVSGPLILREYSPFAEPVCESMESELIDDMHLLHRLEENESSQLAESFCEESEKDLAPPFFPEKLILDYLLQA